MGGGPSAVREQQVQPLGEERMTNAVVHIVDDDASVRASLDNLFRSVGLETRLFASAQEFLDSGQTRDRGCLVLDVRLPGLNGLDLQERLAAGGVRMPVVMMTGYGDIKMSVRTMKAGAIDFLAKPFREQDMLDAVAAAIARDEATHAQTDGVEALQARHDGLTARERQVMRHVVDGLMNKQIAYELGISEITVKVHRASVMRKMEARTLPDLVRMSQMIRISGEAERSA